MTASAAVVLAAAHGGVSTTQDVSIGHLLLQMVVALGIVIGGIWGFGKVMGRTRARRSGGSGRGRAAAEGLHVLSRQQIGKGKSIAVVQAGGQCFLVGIADSGLTPLGELRAAGGDASAPAGVPAHPGTHPSVGALAHRDVPAPSPEPAGPAPGAVELAPVDLAGIDLSALALAGKGGEASRPGRTRTASPSMRAWLDNLREATVRR